MARTRTVVKSRYIPDEEEERNEKRKREIELRYEQAAKKQHRDTCHVIPEAPVTYREICKVHDFSQFLIREDDFQLILDKLEEESGTIKWHQIQGEFQAEEFEKMTRMGPELLHGDLVKFTEYGLDYCYVVYRPEPSDHPVLVRTYGEYGEGIPIDFSDAPLHFYDKVDIKICRFVDPERVWKGELADLVNREVVQQKKAFEETEEPEIDVEPERFPQDYCYCVFTTNEYDSFWVEKEDEAVIGRDQSEKRYHERKERIRKSKLIIHLLFSNVLPRELSSSVAAFVI